MGVLLDLLEQWEYYNAPEGQDPVGKIVGFGKWGFWFGGALGIYDCCLLSKTQNIRQFLNTTGYWVVPLTGMCVAFSGVTYVMARSRGVDDHLNYLAGTLASTYIFHTWCKNPIWSMNFLLGATIVAMVKKDAHYYNRLKILEVEDPGKRWMAPWRVLPERNYLFPPRMKWDREDYWTKY